MDTGNVESKRPFNRARVVLKGMGFDVPAGRGAALQLYAALCDYDDAFKMAWKAQILDQKTAKSGRTAADMFQLMEDVIKRHSSGGDIDPRNFLPPV